MRINDITKNTTIEIGHVGEKGYVDVVFDVSEWVERYPDANINLAVVRYGEIIPYPADVEVVGNNAIWHINLTDTGVNGKGKGQLILSANSGDVIRKSNVFTTVNKYSLDDTGERPDAYDAWFTRLTDIADLVHADFEAVEAIKREMDVELSQIEARTDAEVLKYFNEHKDELKGKDGYTPRKGVDYFDGDDYVITEKDYIDIATVTKGLLDPSIEELENSVEQLKSDKMEFYEVAYSGGHIVKDGIIQTYAMLKEIFDNPKYWLYLHDVGVNYLPLGVSDSTDYLQFNAQFDVSNAVRYRSISIDGNNVITTKFSDFEMTNNKATSVNNRNRESETIYPSMKAMTGYSASKTDLENTNTEVESTKSGIESANAEISQLKADLIENKRVDDARWKMSQGIVWDFAEDTAEAYSKAIPTGARLMDVQNIGGKSVVVDGVIKSADVTDVVVKGKNLFDGEIIEGYYGAQGVEINTITPHLNYRSITCRLPRGTYTVGVSCEENIRILRCNNDITGNVEVGINAKTYTFTLTEDSNIYLSIRNASSTNSFTNLKFQIEKGSTATAYSPYTETRNPIPQIELHSAGTVHDEIDFANKQIIRRVGVKVFDGTETYENNGSSVDSVEFYTRTDENLIDFGEVLNATFNKKGTTQAVIPWAMNQRKGASMSFWTFSFPIDVADAPSKAKEWFRSNPQTIYYELAEPIVTDISDLLDDSFENIEVEPNGSITFEQSDTELAVPNKETYLIALKEVV